MCDKYGVWDLPVTSTRQSFTPNPKYKDAYFDWWRVPAACLKSQCISNSVSPVLTVTEEESTIGRNCLIIYWKCLFSSLSSFCEKVEH